MYIKLIRHVDEDENGCYPRSGSSEGKVVPTETLLVECEAANYRKFLAKDLNEMDKQTGRLLESGKVCQMSILNYDPSIVEGGFEYIVVEYIKPGGGTPNAALICPGYDMYIMNEDGKTVDSLRAASL